MVTDFDAKSEAFFLLCAKIFAVDTLSHGSQARRWMCVTSRGRRADAEKMPSGIEQRQVSNRDLESPAGFDTRGELRSPEDYHGGWEGCATHLTVLLRRGDAARLDHAA